MRRVPSQATTGVVIATAGVLLLLDLAGLVRAHSLGGAVSDHRRWWALMTAGLLITLSIVTAVATAVGGPVTIDGRKTVLFVTELAWLT